MDKLEVKYHNERFHAPSSAPGIFEEQYSPLYALRIQQLRPLLLARISKHWGVSQETVLPKILDLINSSQVEGHLSSVKYVIGCIYKNTPIRPSFLKDYTKFVIPSTLEVETREDGDLAELLTVLDEGGSYEEAEKRLGEIIQQRGLDHCLAERDSSSQTTSDTLKYLGNLQKKEKLWFEDASGRVEVDCHGSLFSHATIINKLEWVSGIVIAAEGRLNHHTGKFTMSRWMLTGVDDVIETPSSSLPPQPDRYIGFLSTLNCEGFQPKDENDTKHIKLESEAEDSAEYYQRQLCSLLKKNLKEDPNNGDQTINDICEKIEYVVLCGGLVPDLEGVNVDSNTKLSAFEIAQRKSQIRLDSDDTITKRDKICMNMEAADSFISNLIDESDAIEATKRRLCIMPSHTEPSNFFYPQEPLHTFCLPKTGSKRMENPEKSWKVDLQTNPVHIGIPRDGKELTIVGTSGENIQDCMRYSHNLVPEIDWIERMLLCRHICPTAPDTLPCFPYRVKGAKRFGHITAPVREGGVTADPFCLVKDSLGGEESAPDVLFSGACKAFATRYLPESRRRLIAVPSFAKTHSFCVMNISSPTLDTFEVKLGDPASVSEGIKKESQA